jgi:membrane protease YdiL (CAAX protease family)
MTYVISWACWGTLIAFQIPGGSVFPDAPPPSPLGLILLGVGILSPSIAGVVMTWRTGGRAGLRDLWRRMTRFDLGWRPYLVIFATPLVISLLRVAFHLARSGALLASPLFAQPGLLLPFTVQTFVFGPLMEEPGWRGFALDRVLARWGFLPGSLVLGGLHGLWHLPVFFILGTLQQSWGNPLLEFGLFWAGTLGIAVIFSWLHRASGGSVWAAILFHATTNFGISFLWTLYDGGTLDRLIFVVLTIATAVILMASPKTISNLAMAIAISAPLAGCNFLPQLPALTPTPTADPVTDIMRR